MKEAEGMSKKHHTPELSELESENARLKELVTATMLDNAILKEAARGNC